MEKSLITSVMSAADGKIIGRIRLQKIFYLLEQLGLNSGVRYSYYHYGPYSEELSKALLTVSDSVKETYDVTHFGAKFSIFNLEMSPPEVEKIGDLNYQTARDSIKLMKLTSSVVIELAATIHWLKNIENVDDWRTELTIRKPTKASDENVNKALELLKNLEL